MGKILVGLNQERAAAQLALLVRDAALNAEAAQGATLPGHFTRRYVLEASGEKPAAPRSPRLLETSLTHCGVAPAEQAVGQHFLVTCWPRPSADQPLRAAARCVARRLVQ